MTDIVAAKPTQAFVDMRRGTTVVLLGFHPIITLRREARNDR